MVEHAGVLVHRVGPEAFELMCRSRCEPVDWLTESAAEFGYVIEE